MKLRNIASPGVFGLLLLAVPLLTGANGKGCGGGDVVVGGDGGSGAGNTGSGNACSKDSDCKIENESCLVCADGSCGPTRCVQGTCQKTCDVQPSGCQSDADCDALPHEAICEVCADGSCAPWACHQGTCSFQCSGGVNPTGGGGAGGTGGGTGTGTTGSTGTGVQCGGANPSQFPSFDKSCNADADCSLVFHQVNCCGTKTAIGINNNEAASFAAAEAVCESQYPACGCAEGPTTAEDGKTPDPSGMIQVHCDAGLCKSFVP
jgi:hypothetical protein